MSMTQTQEKKPGNLLTSNDIFLFIPNLIGYSRVFSAILSLFLMKNHPIYCTIVYSISCLLDAGDGFAARKYNQTSRFGAVLDMVTDRCTTSALICYLCNALPQFMIFFQLLTSLDLASHYMHMYATVISGGSSHKNITKESSWLLNLYYTNKKVLFTACLFNELFYLALYLREFDHLPTIFNVKCATILVFITLPLFIFKQFTNIVQLKRAAVLLADIDCDERNSIKSS
ncbi:CDP-diacylglycerol--inositol 3-phosphatidyltransferase [Ascoidea rubescens DSM 1968]|uniref:CDP-diacylglycerol--inositol 3-phosphatidyltransferase n=1 Tax=Ascoidea rubescens DSM 1968 TaxID=1344418 RepID=A0A1D2VFQ5_9ASCO|nr:CDP-diacylglycerol--inositol 3-phosphatidyltransferase [Ascoidea rubescens DSM 1968]ODV60504.1 CDP-diacylglycerol--inositol 3-phosphatidyltransferase [Ascoidea rubescens DSM 1968]